MLLVQIIFFSKCILTCELNKYAYVLLAIAKNTIMQLHLHRLYVRQAIQTPSSACYSRPQRPISQCRMTCVHLINNRAPWRSFFAVGSIASNRYGMAPYFLNPNVSSTNIVRSKGRSRYLSLYYKKSECIHTEGRH